MKNIRIAILTAVSMTLFITACAFSDGGPKKMYSGTSKPPSEVAVYKAAKAGNGWIVAISTVDGKPDFVGAEGAAVLPGPHQISTYGVNIDTLDQEARRMKAAAGTPVPPEQAVELNAAMEAQKARTMRTITHTAAAGKTYTLTCDANGGNPRFVETRIAP